MYLPSLRSFIRPRSQNFIPTNLDRHEVTGETGLRYLFRTSGGRAGKPGSGYEVFSFMNYTVGATTTRLINGQVKTAPGVKTSQSSVQSHARRFNAFGLRAGGVADPARVWLIHDADEKYNDDPNVRRNAPDPIDNDGTSATTGVLHRVRGVDSPVKLPFLSFALSGTKNRILPEPGLAGRHFHVKLARQPATSHEPSNLTYPHPAAVRAGADRLAGEPGGATGSVQR